MSALGAKLVAAAAKRAKRHKTDAPIADDVAVTPALRALLAYDRDWVPAFKKKPKRLRTSEVVARALKKLKLTGGDPTNFDSLRMHLDQDHAHRKPRLI